MNAIRIIAIQVRPKLMIDDRGGFVGLGLAEQRQVRAECRPGQERRDRELADDDGEGQEGAATAARRGGSAG